jgi:hypothetical protein
MSLGLLTATVADIHHMREVAMRLVAYLAICLFPIMASAAQTGDQGSSNPEAYCVDGSAAFYPYAGEPCKKGYQLGLGNCRKTDGRMVAVPREQCVAMAGTVELPFERGIAPPKFIAPLRK